MTKPGPQTGTNNAGSNPVDMTRSQWRVWTTLSARRSIPKPKRHAHAHAEKKTRKWGGDRRAIQTLGANSPFFELELRHTSHRPYNYYFCLPLTRSTSDMVWMRPVFPFSLVDPYCLAIPASPRILWRSPLELFLASPCIIIGVGFLFLIPLGLGWGITRLNSCLLSPLSLLVSVETGLLLTPDSVVMLWALLKHSLSFCFFSCDA